MRSARERGLPLPRSLAERIGRCSDLLVGQALAYPEARPPRPAGAPAAPAGPHLALRLRDRQAAVLRCVSDPRVPCTHNPAHTRTYAG